MYKPLGKDAGFQHSGSSKTNQLWYPVSSSIYSSLATLPPQPAQSSPACLLPNRPLPPRPQNQQQHLQPVSPNLPSQQHFLVTQAHLAWFLMPKVFVCFYNQTPDCFHYFFYLNFCWSTVALQSCVHFCCTAKWISYMYTAIPLSPDFFFNLKMTLL